MDGDFLVVDVPLRKSVFNGRILSIKYIKKIYIIALVPILPEVKYKYSEKICSQ